ncbi:hypothetical protein [Saccharopolyspora shandongensis]|uniref:hypothetical protein n=1 Tax=Saccharopolyspora shandongensis TaxID=418495 RepID=UPI001C434003|nr:hypothetical protein [Saccharopolyspora shandongensis]
MIDEHVWYQAWLASAQSMAMWADLTSGSTRKHDYDMVQAAEHWRQTVSAST